MLNSCFKHKLSESGLGRSTASGSGFQDTFSAYVEKMYCLTGAGCFGWQGWDALATQGCPFT